MLKKSIIFIFCLLGIVFLDQKLNLASLFVLSFYIVCIIIFKKDVNIDSKHIIFKKKNYIIVFLSALFLISIMVLYSILVNKFINEDTYYSSEFNNNYYNLIIIITLSIFEEIIFRGYFLNSMLNLENKYKSILINSLLFSIAHLFSDSGLLIVFISSFFIGYIYSYTKSLYIVCLTHVITNLFTIFFLDEIVKMFLFLK